MHLLSSSHNPRKRDFTPSRAVVFALNRLMIHGSIPPHSTIVASSSTLPTFAVAFRRRRASGLTMIRKHTVVLQSTFVKLQQAFSERAGACVLAACHGHTGAVAVGAAQARRCDEAQRAVPCFFKLKLCPLFNLLTIRQPKSARTISICGMRDRKYVLACFRARLRSLQRTTRIVNTYDTVDQHFWRQMVAKSSNLRVFSSDSSQI